MTTFADRRKKYGNKNIDNGIRFNLDITIMDLFMAYSLSENINIHRTSLVSLQNTFARIDESMFENNPPCMIRFRFIKDVLATKLDKGITNRNLIIRDVRGMVGDKYPDIPAEIAEVPNDDVLWAERAIAELANLVFINNSVIDLGNLCTEYRSTDYTHKSEVVERIKTHVANMQSNFRRNSVDSDDLNNTVDLMHPENAVADVYANISRPSYKLRTGIQALNAILAGGVEGGRVYGFFGLPGDGKTITLENLAYQFKKYNKDYVCKDKTKIPCIVFLTMENKAQEVLQTLFNIACDSRPMSQFSQEEVNYLIRRELGVTEDSPINIVIRYKPINSVNTDYLYKLTEDLADEGYEVICMIQDYIKRIRPHDYANDMRIDMGNVINDFRNYAIYYNIPVITASQFNREGVRTIDESRSNNRHDLVSRLGRAMIGESGLIDENLDASIFITREIMQDGQNFMGFKLTKHRYRIFTNNVIFYQPFDKDCAIRYIEDEGCAKGAYRLKLIRDEEAFKQAFGETIKLEPKGVISELMDEIQDKETTPDRRESLENSILGGNVITSDSAAYQTPITICTRFVPMDRITKDGRYEVVRRVN